MSVYPTIYAKYNRKGRERPVFVREDLKGHEGTYMLCYGCRRYPQGHKKANRVPNVDDCGYMEAIAALSDKLGITLVIWECPLFDARKTVKYHQGRKGWKGGSGKARKTKEEDTG